MIASPTDNSLSNDVDRPFRTVPLDVIVPNPVFIIGLSIGVVSDDGTAVGGFVSFDSTGVGIEGSFLVYFVFDFFLFDFSPLNTNNPRRPILYIYYKRVITDTIFCVVYATADMLSVSLVVSMPV